MLLREQLERVQIQLRAMEAGDDSLASTTLEAMRTQIEILIDYHDKKSSITRAFQYITVLSTTLAAGNMIVVELAKSDRIAASYLVTCLKPLYNPIMLALNFIGALHVREQAKGSD